MGLFLCLYFCYQQPLYTAHSSACFDHPLGFCLMKSCSVCHTSQFMHEFTSTNSCGKHSIMTQLYRVPIQVYTCALLVVCCVHVQSPLSHGRLRFDLDYNSIVWLQFRYNRLSGADFVQNSLLIHRMSIVKIIPFSTSEGCIAAAGVDIMQIRFLFCLHVYICTSAQNIASC